MGKPGAYRTRLIKLFRETGAVGEGNEKTIEEYFPTNATLQYRLAVALYKEKQYENAVKAAKQALAFTFENSFVAELNLLLGDIYFELGQKEDAVKYWKTAQRKGVNTSELQEKISTNQ